MAATELDSLQSRFEQCRVVAFADVSTRMILITNSDSKMDRGALDKLCAEAGLLLSGDGKPTIGTNVANVALRRTPQETVVFVRSETEPNDALICVCAPDLDIGKFIPEALGCVNQIGLG